ncbi:preprotein translocase subunit SecG [Candidatus Sumerlaeota bacterium]|nr:preprotein translocase subunit SecG [Candidatus Sumerlaeota bacterium]
MLVAILWILGLIYIVVCLLLILFVLVQEGKSGGLAGSESPGAAPSQLIDTFGAGKTQQGLFRATMVAATLFFVIAIGLTLLGSHRDKTGGNLDLPSETPAETTKPVASSDKPVATTGAPATSETKAAPAEPAQEKPAVAPKSDAPVAPPATQ